MSKWNRYVEVDFPFQVDVELESFCEFCPEVVLRSWTDRTYENDGQDPKIVKNVVSCYHIDTCRKMFERFRLLSEAYKGDKENE